MNNNKKVYKSAPLPFQGQKRRLLNDFKKALATYQSDATYVDLFGGSGLLSHATKRHYPDATVIYNDYDNYRQRLDAVDETNALLGQLRALVVDCDRKKRITGKTREKILEAVRAHENKYGYVDYISLSGSLLFSMNYVMNFKEFETETFYNRVRKSDFECNDYLEGLEVVSNEYQDLFSKYKDQSNVVFLIDPPYLQTNSTTYSNYWQLGDYLDVLNVLDGQSYIYFTSNKSSIIELCEWIGNSTFTGNPFEGAELIGKKTSTSHNSSYTDMMLYK